MGIGLWGDSSLIVNPPKVSFVMTSQYCGPLFEIVSFERQ